MRTKFDTIIYLIYPGISNCYYNDFLDNNSSYIHSLDYIHQNQKKYVFVQCNKDFYENIEDVLWYNRNDVNKIMIFYQKESL